MDINQFNLNQMRIFESVYRLRSMTKAAQELFLTQSGVSQHISHLEEFLGVPLFDRVRQRILPTPASELLYQSCTQALSALETTLHQIKEGPDGLRGTVRLGMPMEFGNNVVLPKLAEFLRKNPSVKLKVHIGFAPEMNSLLMNGQIDFALIDQFRMDPSVVIEKIYDEVLELCISESLLKSLEPHPKGRKLIEALPFVDYQEGEPILRMWLAHHYGSPHIPVQIRAHVMDAQGLARLIMGGAGAGILPGHLVDRLIREGAKLHKIKGPSAALKNSISLATIAGRTLTTATEAMIKAVK